MLKHISPLLPVGLGLRCPSARPTTPTIRIGAMLVVLLQVPELLLLKSLSAHISECCCECC
jgi:hypothetical protein